VKRYRVGGHHKVTIIEYDDADHPDDRGRRPSDRLVAMARTDEDADALVRGLNRAVVIDSLLADVPLACRHDSTGRLIGLGEFGNDDFPRPEHALTVEVSPDGSKVASDETAFPLVRAARDEPRPVDPVTVDLHTLTLVES
jgi:hypothetical protein